MDDNQTDNRQLEDQNVDNQAITEYKQEYTTIGYTNLRVLIGGDWDNHFFDSPAYNLDEAKPIKIGNMFTIDENVYGRYIYFDNSRSQLAVIVDEAITSEVWRKIWPKVDQEREYLKKSQGTDSIYNRLMYPLYFLHNNYKNNWSYARLARELNYDVMVLTCVLHDARNYLELLTFARDHILWTLTAVQMSEKEAKDLMIAGVKTIMQGDAPWLPSEQPISRRRMIDAVRKFDRNLKSGKDVVLTTNSSALNILYLRWITILDDYFIRFADQLLEKTYPNYYQRFQNQQQNRLNDLRSLFELEG
jgi:hypothetical protein